MRIIHQSSYPNTHNKMRRQYKLFGLFYFKMLFSKYIGDKMSEPPHISIIKCPREWLILKLFLTILLNFFSYKFYLKTYCKIFWLSYVHTDKQHRDKFDLWWPFRMFIHLKGINIFIWPQKKSSLQKCHFW